MPDEKLVIRKENFPTRCEICHQADLFNPETGECRRCAGLSVPPSGGIFTLPGRPYVPKVPSIPLNGWVPRAANVFARILFNSVLVFGISLLLIVNFFLSNPYLLDLALLVIIVSGFGMVIGFGGLLVLTLMEMGPVFADKGRKTLGKNSETNG